MNIFRIAAALIVCMGATMDFSVVWDTADVLMGLMALINLPVIVLLAKPALRCMQDYFKQKKSGKILYLKQRILIWKQRQIFGTDILRNMLKTGLWQCTVWNNPKVSVN